MLGFILLKTPLKATSMFMGLEEEQAAPHTKIGHVIYVTGEHLDFHGMVAVLRSWTFSQAMQKPQLFSVLVLMNQTGWKLGRNSWSANPKRSNDNGADISADKTRYRSTNHRLQWTSLHLGFFPGLHISCFRINKKRVRIISLGQRTFSSD